jgi:hypothetical protein
MRKTFIAIALVAVVALVAGPATAGGKGGGKGRPSKGGGTGTLDIVLLNSTDGLPHFGQKVTFSVSTTATAYPWVTVKCYVGSGLVYRASNGIFPTSLGQVFTLGPTPSWSGGDADCTAFLENWDSYSKNGSISTLGSTDFHVYA